MKTIPPAHIHPVTSFLTHTLSVVNPSHKHTHTHQNLNHENGHTFECVCVYVWGGGFRPCAAAQCALICSGFIYYSQKKKKPAELRLTNLVFILVAVKPAGFQLVQYPSDCFSSSIIQMRIAKLTQKPVRNMMGSSLPLSNKDLGEGANDVSDHFDIIY